VRLNRSSSNRERTFIESTSTNDFEHEYEHQHERDMDTYDEAFGRYTIGKLFPFPLSFLSTWASSCHVISSN